MLMLAALMAAKVVLPEQGLSLWWHEFAYPFHVHWVYGEGIYLFVLEPLLIIFSAMVAQVFCKLKPKTIWSAPGLLLGTYMCFWLQPVVYGMITGNEWEPIDSVLFSTPLTLGAGQLLLVKRGFQTNWGGALRFDLAMLATNYFTCLFIWSQMPR